MAQQKWVVARTAEELAEVLNLDPVEVLAWDFQIQLANRIAQEVSRRKLTHAQAAKLAGTSRSRMTAILNGGLVDISTDLLLRVLASLGIRVKPTFSRAAA
jgi:predicted XRE-type DNA-binding protein